LSSSISACRSPPATRRVSSSSSPHSARSLARFLAASLSPESARLANLCRSPRWYSRSASLQRASQEGDTWRRRVRPNLFRYRGSTTAGPRHRRLAGLLPPTRVNGTPQLSFTHPLNPQPGQPLPGVLVTSCCSTRELVLVAEPLQQPGERVCRRVVATIVEAGEARNISAPRAA
jgi:hypothetical protein